VENSDSRTASIEIETLAVGVSSTCASLGRSELSQVDFDCAGMRTGPIVANTEGRIRLRTSTQFAKNCTHQKGLEPLVDDVGTVLYFSRFTCLGGMIHHHTSARVGGHTH